ncbi:MAG TPA: serine hydrolase domain-containing protein [Cytophagaceae bacterium]
MRKYFQYLTVCFLLVTACSDKDRKQQEDDILKIDTIQTRFPQIDSLVISNAPEDLEKAKKIEELVQKEYNRRAFNGTVLVVNKGKVIYASAKGKANFNTQTDLTIHSSFHLASVSKQFTAMAIMMLKEQGKLDYDDDITKYLSEIPYKGITIRNLLNHTSGLPNILNYVPHYLSYWDSCKIARNADLPYILQTTKPRIQYHPNQRFSYNNTGYVLLAVLVETIAQMPYEEFIEKNIFKPLNMTNSCVYNITDESKLTNRAYGYTTYRGRYVLNEDDIRNGFVGEKGIYSSVVDLYKWDRALNTELLVSKETLEEAFSYSTVKNGRKINYGFGWRKSKKEEQIVYHFGHWRAFNSLLLKFTKDDNTIILLNNTGSRRIKKIARDIINVLYENEKEVPEF